MKTRMDRALLQLLQEGLPLTERPYAGLAAALQVSEQQLVARLQALAEERVLRRLGIIVRHRTLGYRANAMVVWDIPDREVEAVATRLAANPRVSLCYQRPRRLPAWPYNLFCMIHGKERATVLRQLAELSEQLELGAYRHEVLFSTRCFKQRGGRYIATAPAELTAGYWQEPAYG